MQTEAAIVVPTLRDNLKLGARLDHAVSIAGVDCLPVVVEDRSREGYTRTVNRGIRLALKKIPNYAHILVMVDDCVPVTNNWLVVLIDEMESRASATALFSGPSGTCRTHPQNTGTVGDHRQPKFVDHLAGFCWLINRRVIDELGLLDEQFEHYASDVDYQWRAHHALGARSLWVPRVYVEHKLHEPISGRWMKDHHALSNIWEEKR